MVWGSIQSESGGGGSGGGGEGEWMTKMAVLKLLLSIKIYRFLLDYNTKHIKANSWNATFFFIVCFIVNILKYVFIGRRTTIPNQNWNVSRQNQTLVFLEIEAQSLRYWGLILRKTAEPAVLRWLRAPLCQKLQARFWWAICQISLNILSFSSTYIMLKYVGKFDSATTEDICNFPNITSVFFFKVLDGN